MCSFLCGIVCVGGGSGFDLGSGLGVVHGVGVHLCPCLRVWSWLLFVSPVSCLRPVCPYSKCPVCVFL